MVSITELSFINCSWSKNRPFLQLKSLDLALFATKSVKTHILT